MTSSSEDLTLEFLFQKAMSLGLNIEIGDYKKFIRISSDCVAIAEIIEPNLQNLIKLSLVLMNTYGEIHGHFTGEESSTEASESSTEASEASEEPAISIVNHLVEALTNGEMNTDVSSPTQEQIESIKNILQNVDIEQMINPELLNGVKQVMQGFMNGISQIPGCESLQGTELPDFDQDQINNVITKMNETKQKFLDELD